MSFTGPPTPPLVIDYTNWKGERRPRTIVPLRVFYGRSEFHQEPQWFIHAIDMEKQGTERYFSITGFVDAPHGASEGIKLVAAEVEAHATREGYTTEGDDGYGKGELALAGSCYIAGAISSPDIREGFRHAASRGRLNYWPSTWDQTMFKMGRSDTNEDRIRELVKGASLIVQEINRRLRLKERQS
jgi:hypothetical protein